MLNLDFLKNLFKVGMTKEQFITAYSEMYSEIGVTGAQLEEMSIFDADKNEAIASDLFDMLNLNKSGNDTEEILDQEEINALANLNKDDGENNLTLSDFSVLMKNYKDKLSSEIQMDTPENMYNTAMAKPADNGNPGDSYLQSLSFQISTLESLAYNRQLSSTQLLMNYNNEINNLIQNDTSLSNEFKSNYNKENEKLNNLLSKQLRLETQIKAKQDELTSANDECTNLKANIERAQNSENPTDYTSALDESQANVSSFSEELSSLQSEYSALTPQIANAKQSLERLQAQAKEQSSTLRAQMTRINRQIEIEQLSCASDIENYNSQITGLRNAQTYAIEKIQSEMAANTASYGNGDDTYVYDESNYDEAAVAAVEQRWAAKAKKYGLDHKFFVKVTAISKELKCDPNALLAVMNSECGLNAAARNSNGGATGLIQFMPSTARALGTSTDQLAKMSAYDQLDYVAKFFMMNKKTYKFGDGSMTGADLYSLIFLPARANRDVLTSRGEKYYSANAGLDMDNDGNISKADLNVRIQKCMA